MIKVDNVASARPPFLPKIFFAILLEINSVCKSV